MRILHYNWVPFDDPEKRGGGVTVYARNTIEAQAEAGHEMYFLSSGISYNIFRKDPYFRATRNALGARCKSFEIVNSPVLSPSHHSFDLFDTQFEAPEMLRMLAEFLARHGPFDAVHFHNLEGLPAAALELKSDFPDTRFVFSAHNYYSVCPQVNLWKGERKNCRDFHAGRDCVTCLPHQPDRTEVYLANALAFHLKSIGIRPNTWLFRRFFQFAPYYRAPFEALHRFTLARQATRAHRLAESLTPTDVAKGKGRAFQGREKAQRFAERRARMIDIVSRNFDTVLAVSEQTKAVLCRFGFAPEKIAVSYIGTRHAERFDTAPDRPAWDGSRPLRIAYLGYMRTDKGFWFLLKALKKLPADIASRIELVIAARDTGALRDLEKLSLRFASVTHFDGYTHDTLDEVLDGVDLGIVPPIWEDNLPQVAIEIVSRRIPILTSDTGGAQELGNNPDFVFKSGSRAALISRLTDVVEGRLNLAGFWKAHRKPVSMQAHVEDLIARYTGDRAGTGIGTGPATRTPSLDGRLKQQTEALTEVA